MTKILLYSAGMDSFIADYLLKPDILLYAELGSKYQPKETKKIYEQVRDCGIGDRLKVENLSFLGKHEQDNAHIPLRNLFLYEAGSLYGDEVIISALKGESSKDKSYEFRDKTSELVNYLLNDPNDTNKRKVKFSMPFKDKTKSEILKEFIEKGGDIYKLEKYTVSCYSDEYERCGECASCFRRWVAEINNGIDLTHEYHSNPSSIQKTLKKSLPKNPIDILWILVENGKTDTEAVKALAKYKLKL